ncbi:MAG: Maf family protein [Gaiella sp.]
MAELLTLASTSPQRRAILEQLAIPFRVVAPHYVEDDPVDADPVQLVRAHAAGKAHSVHTAGQVTLGVDTTVHVGGRTLGKAADREEARAMLAELAGATHVVVSGLALLGEGFEEIVHATTRVTFAELGEAEIAAYVTTGEWEGRAGAYAIQGLGARLVAGVAGDYLNVVGLPAAALVQLLRSHAPDLLEGKTLHMQG